jgi:hypothetical protein
MNCSGVVNMGGVNGKSTEKTFGKGKEERI